MQFSIRTLLAAVAVVGIGAALWTAEPSWQVGAVEVFLLAWVPASAVMLSIQSAGKVRAFWMGVTSQCIVPSAFLLLIAPIVLYYCDPPISAPESLGMLGEYLDILSQNFRQVLATWAFAPVVGLLIVFTHWLFIRSAGSVDPKD